MFQQNEVHRPSMSEIFTHPWILAETASKEQVMIELGRRNQMVEKQVLAEQEQRAQQKKLLESNLQPHRPQAAMTMRSDANEPSIDSQKPLK